MSQFDAKIIYLKGEDNIVADSLSCLPSDTPAMTKAEGTYIFCPDDDESGEICSIYYPSPLTWDLAEMLSELDLPFPDDQSVNVCSMMSISADKTFLDEIKAGYQEDNWVTKTLAEARPSLLGIKLANGLWYVGDRLVIPCVRNVCETLFCLAYNVLGHFGFNKTYASFRELYYWPNMRKELETSYVPGCMDCEQNKSATSKLCGPLHPLPIPDARRDSAAIDFIGPLLPDSGFNQITSLTDHLGSDIRIIPSNTSMTTKELALSFFNNWYCENGLPLEIVSDRDKLFVSCFWKALHILTGTKIEMSSSFHSETDSASKRTNKTINQLLHYHVKHNQKGWVKTLPLICFNIMNTVNKSTGFSPFQLCMGRSARVIPPLVCKEEPVDNKDKIKAWKIIKDLKLLIMEAQDNLLYAKISQSSQANKNHTLTFPFSIGSRVRLSTLNQHKEFKTSGEKTVAKFMPRFDGPYTVTDINPDHSTVTLDLPNSPNIFPTFPTSMVIPYIKNDPKLFPNREFSRPPALTMEDGSAEYLIRDIVDERRCGNGFRYLIRWTGYGPEEDHWLSGSKLKDMEALDIWLAKRRTS